jgi:hypothetical protein
VREQSQLLTDDYHGREAHKRAMGQWLSEGWSWDWFVTLTYDLDPSRRKFVPGSATHDVVGWGRSDKDWYRWLGDIVGKAAVSEGDAINGPYWFRGREPNPSNRGTHFHALVGGVANVSRRNAHALWFERHGFARIEPYDPTKGAGYYVAKYVAKELGDLVFSPNLGHHVRIVDDGSRSAARRIYPAGWSYPNGPVHLGEGADRPPATGR